MTCVPKSRKHTENVWQASHEEPNLHLTLALQSKRHIALFPPLYFTLVPGMQGGSRESLKESLFMVTKCMKAATVPEC
jgi:hypothetical protein